MAFWTKDTKKEKKPVVAAKPVVKAESKEAARNILPGASSTIIRPHITEKSGLLAQSGVYTFQVTMNANKSSVAQAVKALYKVTPVKIAVVNLPTKHVFVKGRWGSVSAKRKAMVTLKKGDKIDFV